MEASLSESITYSFRAPFHARPSASGPERNVPERFGQWLAGVHHEGGGYLKEAGGVASS